jgi:hypothetical protein
VSIFDVLLLCGYKVKEETTQRLTVNIHSKGLGLGQSFGEGLKQNNLK